MKNPESRAEMSKDLGYYPNSIKVFGEIINKNFPQAKAKEGLDNLPSHLLWMLDKIGGMKNDSGKAGRWLGYVIGRLEGINLLDNKKSRDIVREDVLNKHD